MFKGLERVYQKYQNRKSNTLVRYNVVVVVVVVVAVAVAVAVASRFYQLVRGRVKGYSSTLPQF